MVSLLVLLRRQWAMKKIEKTVRNAIITLCGKPESICVALSGGADSVCLLHILNSLSAEFGYKLSAIHINHNIRGEEAKRDENFCINLCNKMGVPLKVASVSVLSEANKGESVEFAARRLRYKVFEELDAQYIATAHNADDSIETFLINFCRGTGLKGLIGIPDVRGRFVRLLNECSKNDILNYINNNNLEFVTDSTNLDNDYTRNKIRNNIIPILKDFSPELVNISVRNLNILKNDNDYLEEQATKLFNDSYKANSGLKVEKLVLAHSALTSRVISSFIYKITKRYPDNLHINLIFDLLNLKISSVELFDGFYAKVNKGYFCVLKNENIDFYVETELLSKEKFENDCKINKLLLKNAIDCDKIVGELNIRTRMANDRLSPVGRGLSKPVRRLQAEANIGVEIREKVPVAADDNGVIWGYEIGIDEAMKIEDKTKRVLVFKVYKTINGGL